MPRGADVATSATFPRKGETGDQGLGARGQGARGLLIAILTPRGDARNDQAGAYCDTADQPWVYSRAIVRGRLTHPAAEIDGPDRLRARRAGRCARDGEHLAWRERIDASVGESNGSRG